MREACVAGVVHAVCVCWGDGGRGVARGVACRGGEMRQNRPGVSASETSLDAADAVLRG